MFGWMGKILRLDLTKGRISTIETEKYARDYIGGIGIAIRIYWEEVDGKTGALDPGNKLIFMTGPLIGTLSPTSSRTALVGKSPATCIEFIQSSSAGGFFGPELKFAGYDGMVIEGRSTEPVYLWINDEKVELRKAEALWGKNTWETFKGVVDDVKGDSRIQVACIGPAGENLVIPSVIMCCNSGATWGHGGFGAVMGSKKLKAIAVRGTGSVNVAEPEELLRVSNRVHRLISRKDNETEPGAPHRGQGYLKLQSRYNPVGGELQIEEDARKGLARLKRTGCHSCPTQCSLMARYEDDPPGMTTRIRCVTAVGFIQSELKHYRRRKALGKGAYSAAKLANLLGIDVYEYSDFLRWFPMAIESGVLTEENTGLPLHDHGSIEFWEELFSKVTRREGVGDILAQGGERALRFFKQNTKDASTKKWAEKIRNLVWNPDGTVCYFTLGYDSTIQAIIDALIGGKLMRNIAPYHIYDPVLFHCFPTIVPGSSNYELARSNLAKSLFGRDTLDEHDWCSHMNSWAINEGIMMNCLPYCDWSGPWLYSQYTEDYMADASLPAQLFSAVTGIKVTQEELHSKHSEKILSLLRVCEIRDGRKKELDTLPDGAWEEFDWIEKREFKSALQEFFKQKGWNKDGIPTYKTLRRHGLDDVAHYLRKKNLITTN